MSRRSIIRRTTAVPTSIAPTITARPGPRSSTAFRPTISCRRCAKIRSAPGLLFAGTEHGIYVSFDNGAEWQSLRLNLPDTQVADLVVEGDDLVIATHGRSFYILDDITPAAPAFRHAFHRAAHLFTPHPAVRSVNRGAVIDYWLAKEADTVTIDILDAKGAVVRTLRRLGRRGEESESRERPPDADDEEAAVAAAAFPLRAQSRREPLHLGSPLSRRENV